MARALRARPRDLGARRLRRFLPFAGAIASAFAALWVARGVPGEFLALTIAPFAVAAVLFLGATVTPAAARASVLGLAAAAPCAAWATEYSYAPSARAVVLAALVATAMSIVGIRALPPIGRVVALILAAPAAAVLTTLAVAPFALPVGGVWLYAVMALGGTGVAIALVPWRWWIVIAAGVVGWLVAAAVVLFAYGFPLGAT